jgi:hypothetical protein
MYNNKLRMLKFLTLLIYGAWKIFFIIKWKLFHVYNYFFQYTRCFHCDKCDHNFPSIISTHHGIIEGFNNEFTDLSFAHMDHPTSSFSTLLQKSITIDIPLVFHLISPSLSHKSIKEWEKHIIQNIIHQLQIDFNRDYESYHQQYLQNTQDLFVYADETKKDFYLQLVHAFPYGLKIKWNFSLKKIVINPNNHVICNKNDQLFQCVNLIDPESHLNIVVCSGKSILGISVFPFMDRDPNDSSKIDPKFIYRHAIIIESKIFEGTMPNFHLYRTFTHEIGHWCGLLHTFDKCNSNNNIIPEPTYLENFFAHQGKPVILDLPIQQRATYGTVYDSIKIVSQYVNDKWIDNIIHDTPYAYIFEKNDQKPLFTNFMDYTNDEQMCMFTLYQMIQMVYMLSKFRPNFITYS